MSDQWIQMEDNKAEFGKSEVNKVLLTPVVHRG